MLAAIPEYLVDVNGYARASSMFILNRLDSPDLKEETA
jgi:hypothetical protein